MTVEQLVVYCLVSFVILALCIGVWNFIATFQHR